MFHHSRRYLKIKKKKRNNKPVNRNIDKLNINGPCKVVVADGEMKNVSEMF